MKTGLDLEQSNLVEQTRGVGKLGRAARTAFAV